MDAVFNVIAVISIVAFACYMIANSFILVAFWSSFVVDNLEGNSKLEPWLHLQLFLILLK